MTDPRDIIAKSPMPAMQTLVVFITVGLCALDGFDIASISFASPGITAEWGINRATLGVVLSMELVGMGMGSLILGSIADKFGRRPSIHFSLVLMVIGMFGATLSKGVVDLSLWRILTGIGIGGMLAAINAVAAEFSNDDHRHFFISLMVIGYPIGIVIGGTLIRPLLAGYDWRHIFYFGGSLTFLFIPIVYFFVPESISWLTRKQPAGALEKINSTLARFKHNTIPELPHITEDVRKRSVTDLLKPGLVSTTFLVTIAYSFHIMTFYFIIKWVPQIVADMGFAPASAGTVLTLSNVGGAIGGFLFGLITLRFSIKPLTIIVLLLSVVTVSIFGHSPKDLFSLSLLAAIAGFCTNSGVVGIYAIVAHAFPTHVRASGTGVAIGVGRTGAWISPIIAGFLFQSGLGLGKVAMVMAVGSLLSTIAVTFLKLQAQSAE